MITITVPTATIVRGGILHPSATDLVLARSGIKRETIGDLTKFSNITPDTDIKAAELAGVIDASGEVEGVPMFIVVPSATYTGEVPTYFPNRVYYDSNEVEYVRKWREWHDDSHEHVPGNDDTEWLVQGNSWGKELSGNIIAQLYTAGYTMYNLKELRQELNDPNSNFYSGSV